MDSFGNIILDGQANASNMMCVSKASLGNLICTLPSSDIFFDGLNIPRIQSGSGLNIQSCKKNGEMSAMMFPCFVFILHIPLYPFLSVLMAILYHKLKYTPVYNFWTFLKPDKI